MCEKCWTDAFRRSCSDPTKSQSEYYFILIEERKCNPCSPREQAGQFWEEEKKIDARLIHAHGRKEEA